MRALARRRVRRRCEASNSSSDSISKLGLALRPHLMRVRVPAVLISSLALASGLAVWTREPVVMANARQPRDAEFTRVVRPFIEKNCLECHDSATAKGELDLETYKDVT